mgnify:CR=1 FL=1
MYLAVEDYYEAIEKAVASNGKLDHFTWTFGSGEYGDINTIVWYLDVRMDGDSFTSYISHEGLCRGCFQTDWELDFDGRVIEWISLYQDRYPYIPYPPDFFSAESNPSDWEELTLGEYDEPEIGEDGWIKDEDEVFA